MTTTTHHLQYPPAGSFVRIMPDDGEAKREIAQVPGREGSWAQTVKDAELIVAALNAYPEGLP